MQEYKQGHLSPCRNQGNEGNENVYQQGQLKVDKEIDERAGGCHIKFTSSSLLVHFDFTSSSRRVHFELNCFLIDATAISLQNHFAFTSDFTSMRCRNHFDVTSMLRRLHFDVTPISLRHRSHLAPISRRIAVGFRFCLAVKLLEVIN